MNLELCRSRSNKLRKRQSRMMGGVLAILVAIILLSGNVVEARAVRIGVYDNPPKVEIGSDNIARGIFIDIIEYIAEREGWDIQYVYGSWNEGLQRLDEGSIDLMPDVAFSEVRNKRFSFNKLAVQHSWLQVFSAKDVAIRTVHDLEGKTIAVLEGGIQQVVCDELREKFGINFNVVTRPDYKGTINEVESGKADAILAGRFYGFNTGKNSSLTPTPVILRPAPLLFAAPKGSNQELLNVIDKTIAEMMNDPDSEYYRSLAYWLDEKPQMFIPRFVLWSIASITAILLFFFVCSLALKRQVAMRTKELKKKNSALQVAFQELKLARDKALKRERLYAFGQLASGTVHDFNNLLAPIIGYVDMMLSDPGKLENREEVRKTLEAIKMAADHGAEIVHRMQEFCRSVVYKEAKSCVDANTVVREAIEIGSHRLKNEGYMIKLVLALGDDCEITGRRFSLHEMLLNLIINAADAMPKGGCLEISTINIDSAVRITVKDNGVGMTEEIIKKCLEPFFTSKGDAGTGMGLTMVNNIMADHHGHLEIKSVVGAGTSFIMTFPRET